MSNVQHSSRSDNWGTPNNIVEMVHQVIGYPDLDPASSDLHNRRIKAKRIITQDQNALSIPWYESADRNPVSVFVNPPGGKVANQSLTKLFWKKLIDLRSDSLLIEGIFMCFSVEALQNSQVKCATPMGMFPVCIPSSRIKFLDQTEMKRSAPFHSNAIVYVPGLADNSDLFYEVFRSLGTVLKPYR